VTHPTQWHVLYPFLVEPAAILLKETGNQLCFEVARAQAVDSDTMRAPPVSFSVRASEKRWKITYSVASDFVRRDTAAFD